VQAIFGIKDIISDKDRNVFISFIDDNLDLFVSYEDEDNPLRKVLRFGVDEVWKDSMKDLGLIPGVHSFLRELFSNITSSIQKQNGGPKLYVTSFHLAKQLAGARVDLHNDSDQNNNGHFKYSTVVYLNSVSDGALSFPNKGIKYLPKAGEMIVFPPTGKDWVHEVERISEDRYSLPIWLTEDPELELSFFA
jgi:hypothetical protein